MELTWQTICQLGIRMRSCSSRVISLLLYTQAGSACGRLFWVSSSSFATDRPFIDFSHALIWLFNLRRSALPWQVGELQQSNCPRKTHYPAPESAARILRMQIYLYGHIITVDGGSRVVLRSRKTIAGCRTNTRDQGGPHGQKTDQKQRALQARRQAPAAGCRFQFPLLA